ncbi:two-component system response regulator BaeR [Aliidiomarina iranensis]|uniref:Two-component system response regulator BaeR n=1 Tax=Aliidiomarina iranensis TaxID=1434071 RepID=A0A432W287_9GAMM|nr:response regulator [Aliidiomarina iranensis]RUO23331.1 two-component system response regulator BaeR [Aliidiomarina iranensis]
MTDILIVEDEAAIQQLLVDYLQQAGYKVKAVKRGDDALECIRESAPDLVLLDVMLPGIDGLEVCRQVREFSHVPIVFLTARHDEIDRIVGLRLGADDYIVKPFSPREVVARVDAMLRRSRWYSELAEKGESTGLHINNRDYQAFWGDQLLDLTPVEFRLLSALHAHPGRVYRRDELINIAYDDHRIVSDRTVDSHIKNLRQKLHAAGAGDIIQAVYGVGYRYLL